MAFLISIHPQNPQPRLVRQAIAAIRDGSVVVYPTDSSYALGCLIGDKEALKWAQWEDPKAIALLAEANGSIDEARRKAIFVELHRMAAQQVPVIGLYFSTEIEAAGPKVRGHKPWPAGKPLPWGVWKAG